MTELPPIPFEETEETQEQAFLRSVSQQEESLAKMPAIQRRQQHQNSLNAQVELPGVSGRAIDLINDRFTETIKAAQSAREWLYDAHPAKTPSSVTEELTLARENALGAELIKMHAIYEVRNRAQNKDYNGQSVQMRLKAESKILANISAGEGAFKAREEKFIKQRNLNQIHLYED